MNELKILQTLQELLKWFTRETIKGSICGVMIGFFANAIGSFLGSLIKNYDLGAVFGEFVGAILVAVYAGFVSVFFSGVSWEVLSKKQKNFILPLVMTMIVFLTYHFTHETELRETLQNSLTFQSDLAKENISYAAIYALVCFLWGGFVEALLEIIKRNKFPQNPSL